MHVKLYTIFVKQDEDELSFVTGDIILVLEYISDEWWRGRLNNNEGMFPSS